MLSYTFALDLLTACSVPLSRPVGLEYIPEIQRRQTIIIYAFTK